MKTHLSLFLLCCMFGGALFGCGSNTAGLGTSAVSNTKQATGRATFTMIWPAPSRLIPQAANSIKVDIRNGTTTVASKTLPRPAGGGSASVTFAPLPVGSLTATATAYPQTDGTGVAQATATIPLTILADQNTTFSLTMATTIDHIEMFPAIITLPVRGTQQLFPLAKDATGDVVLLSAAQAVWDTVDKTVATVSAAGLLTGVNAGSTQVSFKDKESGKVVSVKAIVKPNTPISFAAPTVYNVPHASDSVTAIDLDNDGNPDVIVGGDTELGVLYGNGDGTLQPYQPIITWSAGVQNRAVADLDGDGRPDILFVDGQGNLVILFNKGGRQFAAPVTMQVGNSSSLYVGDINGDNHPDLIFGLWGDGGTGSVEVFLNNGNGTFRQQSTFSHIGIVEGVYAADVNGDGIPDLAVTYETDVVGDSGVSIYYGDGRGNFTGGPTYNVGTQNMNSPMFVDLNGDGKLDLAFCNYWGNVVAVFMNAGDGTFTNQILYNVNTYPLMLRTADFNGDGRLDIVVPNAGTSQISLLQNNGDGTFANAVTFPDGGINTRTIAIADFNKDGKPDIVVESENSKTISILLNTTP